MYMTRLYRNIPFTSRCVCLSLLASLLCACADSITGADTPAVDEGAQWGTLEVTLGSTTRATSTVLSKEEAANYWVTLYKGQDICRATTLLKDLDTRLNAGYGYVLKAESCLESEAELANEGWGQRRYAGCSSSFAIKPGETTKVGVGCTVANAGLEIVFDATIPYHFSTSYSVTIVEGERTIVFDENTGGKRADDIVTPGHIAYYNVGDGDTRTLTYTIEAYGTNKRLVKSGTLVLTKAKVSRLTLTFIPGVLDLDITIDQADLFVSHDIAITDDDVIQDDGSADMSSNHQGYEEADADVDISDYGQ